MGRTKSTRPKADAVGCANSAVRVFIGLIGLGQAAGGVGSLVWAMRAIFEQQNWTDAAIATACAALFGSIGFGLLTAVWLDRPKLQLGVPADTPKDEPWLARPDWATGKIPARGGAKLLVPVLAAVALWWNFASLPLISALPKFLVQVESRWAWLALLLPVAGLLLIAAFMYQLFRAQKFGRPVFEMASVPGVVGGQLAGVVRIPARVSAPQGFRLRLLCAEWRMQSSRNRDHQRVDHVIWQDERVLMNPLLDGNETAVPVLFAIPFELPESSLPESKREFEWRLEARARIPGIDFAATFEVPVFKTESSRKDFQLDEKLLADYAPPPGNQLILRDEGIGREDIAGSGVRLTFRAARNWRSAAFVTVMALAFAGIGFLMLWLNEDAQKFFNLAQVWKRVADNFSLFASLKALLQSFTAIVCGGIYGIVTLVMLLASLDLWLYRSVVEATAEGVTVRGGWLGIGRLHSYPAEDIQRFKVEEYMTSSGGGVWKSIVVVPRRGHGKKRTLGKAIGSKLAQEAVIAELNTALGR